MMRSLEEQLENLRQATNESFVMKNFEAHPAMSGHNQFTLLETVKSEESQNRLKHSYVTKGPTPTLTHEIFKLSEKGNSINSKMLSTYRGNDNMKLKIID